MRAAPLVLLTLAACAPPTREAGREPGPNALLAQMRSCLAEPSEPTCTVVDPARGFVVIKDDSPEKPLAWLIVPTDAATGIEDPAVFYPPLLDFWRYGWDVGRRLVPAAPPALGLAINSKAGRSQNLLHIHISCVLPAAQTALAAAPIGPDWAPAPFVPIAGKSYNVRRVATLDPSPFALLAELPDARADMAGQSLAVVGSPDGGFFILTDSTEPGVVAEAEALLDEACAG